MTTNGLSNKEFQDIRNGLCRDAEAILYWANSTSGHIGDVVSAIRTTQSSLDIKAKKLWEAFEAQKAQEKI